VRQPQHLSALWYHRQYALEQKAVMAAIANRPQSRSAGMVLVIHFRGVLDQQDPRLLAHLRARVLQMGLQQDLVADLRMYKTIGGFQRRRVM
jgi:hypothetical protein